MCALKGAQTRCRYSTAIPFDPLPCNVIACAPTPNKQSILLRPYHQAIAVLVALIWGTNFVVIRIGLDELQPFTFAALRFFFVAIPLIFFLPRPSNPWRQTIAYGLLIGCGQFGLLFWAMQANITPGLASLIVQMQIFITILLAAGFYGESINAKQIAALCVCFAGLAMVALYTDGSTTLIGLGVVLLAASSWAAGNLVVKSAAPSNMLAFIAWSSLFAIPPLVLMAFFLEGYYAISEEILSASWTAWAVILWQSIGNTLIGYGLWNMLLGRYPAYAVTPWALLVPVFGMWASAVFLDEAMTWWKLVAMALIIGGLALNTLAGWQASNAKRQTT